MAISKIPPLTNRLLAVLEQIPQNTPLLIDIGCDHGYLGIAAILTNRAQLVWDVDIHQLPLKSAQDNAIKYGVFNKTAFFVSDGFQKVPPLSKPATLVCAGMGSNMILQILNHCDPLVERLIFLTHTMAVSIREWVNQNNWFCEYETCVSDHGHYYELLVLTKNTNNQNFRYDNSCELLLGKPHFLTMAQTNYVAYWTNHWNRLQKIPPTKRHLFQQQQIAIIEKFLHDNKK